MYKFVLLFTVIFFLSCADKPRKSKVSELNLELSKEIDKMSRLDQQMQMNMLQFMNSSDEELANVREIREQVYEKNAKRIDEILDQYGYPDYQLVGKQSTENFYVIVKHAHAFPEIKNKAIGEMKKVLENNNDLIAPYAFLKDETAIEQEKEQEYGTSVNYRATGQAYVEDLRDSTSVDARRISLGLDSLFLYLNHKTQQYFQANQEALQSQGITEPIFY